MMTVTIDDGNDDDDMFVLLLPICPPGSPYMCSSVKHMTWLLQVGFLCCQTSLFIVTSHKLLVAD